MRMIIMDAEVGDYDMEMARCHRQSDTWRFMYDIGADRYSLQREFRMAGYPPIWEIVCELHPDVVGPLSPYTADSVFEKIIDDYLGLFN